MVAKLYAYSVTLRANAVFPTLGRDPNSAESLPFIPGSAVRGALVRALLNGATLDAAADPLRSLALSGEVCYLNAYPVEQGARTVPTPCSIREAKSGSGPLYDLLAYAEGAERSDAIEAPWPTEPLKPVEHRFITLGKADTYSGRASTTYAFHHQRDRVKGRAYTGKDGRTVGAVFTYESLQKDQAFAGVISITGKDEAEVNARFKEVKALLANRSAPLLLGRSRRAEYGGDADITFEEISQVRETPGDAGLITSDVKKGQRFRALLTSDYIGRDKRTGQMDPLRLAQELEDRLDHKAHVVSPCHVFRTIGGYNSTWKLAVPQANAMAAGAILLLEATEEVPYTLLHGIELSALGERRAEGYGRVLFLNAPTYHPNIQRPSYEREKKPAIDVPPLIASMQRRLLEEALEQTIGQAAGDIAEQAKPLPTSSLLQRLRLPLRESGRDAISAFSRYLDGLKNPARDALMGCRIQLPNEHGQRRLFEWLKEIASDGTRRPSSLPLNLQTLAQNHHITTEEGAFALLTGEMDPWVRQRLLSEVLAALARRAAEGDGEART